jgi:ubiquinone/menaquinone biosynthesis C-methylase UbiE
VDVVCDLERRPWPFGDSSFERVLCSHVLEHLSDLVGTMEELCRVCRPGATVVVTVPHFTSAGAYADPTHRRFFTCATMEYFTPESHHDYYSQAAFRVAGVQVRLPRVWRVLGLEWIANCSPVFYDKYLSYVFRGKTITFVLTCSKTEGSPSDG